MCGGAQTGCEHGVLELGSDVEGDFPAVECTFHGIEDAGLLWLAVHCGGILLKLGNQLTHFLSLFFRQVEVLDELVDLTVYRI